MIKIHKKAIISGGSKGIGLDIVNYLLKKDYKVLCLSRTRPKLNNNNLFFLKIDMSLRSNITKNKKKIISFNPNLLINNSANIGEVGLLEKINVEKWEKSFFLNFFSHVYLTSIILKKIKKNKGDIIFMTGGGAANAFPGFSAYSVAKTAIVRLVENIAEETKKIGCYAISPGPVKTDLLDTFLINGHNLNSTKLIGSTMCIKLINFLLKQKNKRFNGRYIHALDDYEKITSKKIHNNFLLRRVENFKKK
jgi:short-subunit dehydrogenase